MKFYGYIEHKTVTALGEALSMIEFEPLGVELKSFFWGGGKTPQSVWIGVTPNENLTRIHLTRDNAAPRVGLSNGSQNYTPHITMAYCRTTPLEPVLDRVTSNSTMISTLFAVDQFNLYSSHLRDGPNLYTIETRYQILKQT